MQKTGEAFTVRYQDLPVQIETFQQGQQLLFRAVFMDGQSPLFVTKTKNRDKDFWTSVPEGRQALAEALGTQIETFLLSKK